jgi:hypothetical protein
VVKAGAHVEADFSGFWHTAFRLEMIVATG